MDIKDLELTKFQLQRNGKMPNKATKAYLISLFISST